MPLRELLRARKMLRRQKNLNELKRIILITKYKVRSTKRDIHLIFNKSINNFKMKQEFYKYQAQTTQFASGFEVERAEGSYIYGKDGKAYLDFVAGVSANTLGHSHPKIVQAIKEQTDKYLHVMVYGEYAQEKPVALCQL